MEKLYFNTPKGEPHEYPRIRISKEAEEIILNISAETGLTKSYIASAMIKFAAKYTVINKGDSE